MWTVNEYGLLLSLTRLSSKTALFIIPSSQKKSPATQQCHVLYRHSHIHKWHKWTFRKGGKSEKSWLCSFARVTWQVVGCIVCWTCFIAFVGRLTEHTQCGARPRRPQTGSLPVENTLWVCGSNQRHRYGTLASVHLIWAFLAKNFGICSSVATATTKKRGCVLKILPTPSNETLPCFQEHHRPTQ